MGVGGAQILLFAGGKSTLDPGAEQIVLRLERQQAQGAEIHPGAGPDQLLKAGIGLAGVGAAHVDHKVAAHGAGLGVFVARVERNEQLETRADGPWDIPDGIDRLKPLLQKLGHGKVAAAQQLRGVGLGAQGGKALQLPPGKGQQNAGIFLAQTVQNRRSGVAVHPGAQLQKADQLPVGRLRAGALRQGIKAVEQARDLVVPKLGQLPRRPEPRQQAAVVISGQKPRGLIQPRRLRKGALQEPCGGGYVLPPGLRMVLCHSVLLWKQRPQRGRKARSYPPMAAARRAASACMGAGSGLQTLRS